MKHLEETINQYHIQSEKNLEGKKAQEEIHQEIEQFWFLVYKNFVPE